MGKFLFRLRMFMQNRYGTDQLYYGLLVLYIILLLLHFAFVRFTVVARVLNVLSWIVLIIAFYRVFSRNIERRSRENQAFMRLIGRASSGNVTNPFENMTAGFSQIQKPEADKKYVKCPKCKATLRVPRQKGKHTVRCPRCNHRFQIRIFFGAKK